MILALDIETTSKHDWIWCCGLVTEDNEEIALEPEAVQRAVDKADIVVGHNIIAFDAALLESFWGVSIPFEKLRDTLLLSRLWNPSIEGGHSLAAWGKRLKDDKIDFDDYDSGYSEEMGEYCLQDTRLTLKLYKHLMGRFEVSDFSGECIELEHEVQRIVAQQEREGFKFNTEKATELYVKLTSRMSEIEKELQKVFPPIVTERYSEKTGKRLKDKVEVFNPGSRQQIAKRLEGLGVKFTKKTEKGSVVIDEKVLSKIDLPEAKLLLEYLLCSKRASQVDSWINAVKDDGRVHGKVITNGAVTGRMTHHSPNMAQVPAVYAQFGKECRELWTVEEDNVLVGIDASGLELRMLAHYMDDEDYINEVVSGDVHTANQKAAELPDRATAKTFIYAFLYGAGTAKIGSIVGGSAKRGQALKDKFLSNTPALKDLLKKVRREAAKGSLPALDGRKLRIRSEHAALNTLLQGAGAIIMKKALVLFVESLERNRIPYRIVANVHDEWQVETPEWYGDAVGRCGVRAIRRAGMHYDLRCPLDGEYRVGRNWAETH